MPIVAKHYALYIMINTPINIYGSTYYKNDINLSQYTQKEIFKLVEELMIHIEYTKLEHFMEHHTLEL